MSETIDGETARPRDYQDERLVMQIENLKAEPAFFELLDTAKALCFEDQTVFDEALAEIRNKRVESDESTLIRHLGLWGCRSLLDVPTEARMYDYSEHTDGFAVTDLIASPHALSAPPEKHIQDSIEAFGKAILADTFKCLGEDASEKVEAFRSAQSDGDRERIISWLVKRVTKMLKVPTTSFRAEIDAIAATIDESMETFLRARQQLNAENQNQNEPHLESSNNQMPTSINDDEPFNREEDAAINNHYFYHPTRLSPRFMEAYPDNNMVPTCLGVSLLVASFFEKAGVPYMHAGVMQTPMDAGRLELILNTERTLEYVERLKVTQTLHIKPLLEEMQAQLWKIVDVNRGHHAAVIAKSSVDYWTYIDPNYHTLVRTPDGSEAYTELDKLYDNLKALDESIAGTEAINLDGYGLQSFFYTHLLDLVEKSDVLDDLYERIAELASLSMDLLEPLKTALLTYLTVDESGEETTAIDDLTDGIVLPHVGKTKEEYIDDVLTKILDKFIFKDIAEEDRRAYFKACAANIERHPEFAVSVNLAARLMAIKLQQDYVNACAEAAQPPPATEVGLPHYRVGAAVLSDFAVYCGDELPSSFWTTYWPSQIVFDDHIADSASAAPYQKELALRMAEYMDVFSILRYINSYDIVQKFLEQEGVNKNGHQQAADGKNAG